MGDLTVTRQEHNAVGQTTNEIYIFKKDTDKGNDVVKIARVYVKWEVVDNAVMNGQIKDIIPSFRITKSELNKDYEMWDKIVRVLHEAGLGATETEQIASTVLESKDAHLRDMRRLLYLSVAGDLPEGFAKLDDINKWVDE